MSRIDRKQNVMKLQKLLFGFLLIASLNNCAMEGQNLGSATDDSPIITAKSRAVLVDTIEKREAGCANVLGCEFVLVCQKLYKAKFPSSGSMLTEKISELPKHVSSGARAFINNELINLAHCVPFLGESWKTGKPVEVKVNSKGDVVALFSQNPYYSLALAAIKDYNSPLGLFHAINQAKKKEPLHLGDRFKVLKSHVIGAHRDAQGDVKLIVVCGACAQQPQISRISAVDNVRDRMTNQVAISAQTPSSATVAHGLQHLNTDLENSDNQWLEDLEKQLEAKNKNVHSCTSKKRYPVMPKFLENGKAVRTI